MSQKTRPAPLAGAPASKSGRQNNHQHRLDSEAASHSKPHKPNFSPADARPAPDVTGEDDWQYFRARPGATVRTRFALPNEFPIDFSEHCAEHCGGGDVVVRIAVTRDDRGEPVWGARSVTLCQRGTA